MIQMLQLQIDRDRVLYIVLQTEFDQRFMG